MTQVTHLKGVGLLRVVVGALFQVAPKKGEGTLLPIEISSTRRRTARPHSVTRPAARQAACRAATCGRDDPLSVVVPPTSRQATGHTACHSIGHAAGSGPEGAVGETEEAVEGAVRQEAVDQQETAGPAPHGVPSPGTGALDGAGDGAGDGGWIGGGPGVARTQHATDEGRLAAVGGTGGDDVEVSGESLCWLPIEIGCLPRQLA